jgi:hypothetical protein
MRLPRRDLQTGRRQWDGTEGGGLNLLRGTCYVKMLLLLLPDEMKLFRCRWRHIEFGCLEFDSFGTGLTADQGDDAELV